MEAAAASTTTAAMDSGPQDSDNNWVLAGSEVGRVGLGTMDGGKLGWWWRAVLSLLWFPYANLY